LEYKLNLILGRTQKDEQWGLRYLCSLKGCVLLYPHCFTDTHTWPGPVSLSPDSSCAILDHQVCPCVMLLPASEPLYMLLLSPGILFLFTWLVSAYLSALGWDATFFFFFVVTGLELRAYTLSHSTSPFYVCVRYFQDRVSRTICSGWLWTLILLISASWVARITGVRYHFLKETSLNPDLFLIYNIIVSQSYFITVTSLLWSVMWLFD
jgi:hypothetical protein